MITISDIAVEKIQEMMAQEENAGLFLRLGVRPGGCSGFSYGMGFDDEESEADVHMEVSGMKIVIDKESMPYLNGLVIDFKESGMSGGFTIDNPNAIATCGCGSSFRTAKDEGKAEKCDD